MYSLESHQQSTNEYPQHTFFRRIEGNYSLIIKYPPYLSHLVTKPTTCKLATNGHSGTLATHCAQGRLIRLGGCPVWSFVGRTCHFLGFVTRRLKMGLHKKKLGSLATHWVHSEDSDQTGRMPRLIWVFTGRTCQYVGFVMRRLICFSEFTYQDLSCVMTKPTKWHVRPAKTQISLGIRPVWSESSLCAQWVAKDPTFLNVDNEDSDQTGQIGWSEPLLGAHAILLVLSWGSWSL